MKGGAFNRVIGVSIPEKDGPERGQYVLRIPRFETAQMLNDLASLEFINRSSDLSVPEFVASDCTTQNVLESPYMIQRRLRGSPLISLYPEMGHESRFQTARQLGEALASLTSLRSHRIGRFASSNDEVGRAQFLVQVLDDTGPTASWLPIDAPATQDTSEALKEIFNYQNDMAVAAVDDFRSEYMQRFATMTSEIGDMGYLQDIPISLCHLEFEMRNILIDLQDQAKPVSGIIDWDSAVFAPSFVSCTPPMWIWTWKDDEEEDERTANDTPLAKEGCEFKEFFEKAAGPVYMRFAYDPVYRLARQLVQFAFSGIRFAEDIKQVDSMLQEWSDMSADTDQKMDS